LFRTSRILKLFTHIKQKCSPKYLGQRDIWARVGFGENLGRRPWRYYFSGLGCVVQNFRGVRRPNFALAKFWTALAIVHYSFHRISASDSQISASGSQLAVPLCRRDCTQAALQAARGQARFFICKTGLVARLSHLARTEL
jgi:hypothetical protein